MEVRAKGGMTATAPRQDAVAACFVETFGSRWAPAEGAIFVVVRHQGGPTVPAIPWPRLGGSPSSRRRIQKKQEKGARATRVLSWIGRDIAGAARWLPLMSCYGRLPYAASGKDGAASG